MTDSQNTMTMKFIFIGIILLLLFTACKKESVEEIPIIHPSCGDQESPAVYKIIFLHHTGNLFFYAATTDTSVIRNADEELSKPLENRLKHINGLLAPGECKYNPNYDWHFILNEWDLVEASIEWCDAFPANPDYTGIDRVCPWASKVYERIN